MIQGALDLIDLLERQMAERKQQMGDCIAPLQPQGAQLDSRQG